MKKIILLIAVITCVSIARAASVDWKISGEKSYSGNYVCLLGTIESSYASASELIADSIGSGTIQSKGREFAFATTSTSSLVTKETMAQAYLVIIQEDTYTYVKVNLADKVYDVDNQETSKGFYTTKVEDMLSNGTTASFVPEPTSGLMLILGVASLALRRKRD